MDLTQTISAALGAGGTGALVLFVAKLLVTRWLDANEARHKEHVASVETLEEKLSAALSGIGARLDKVTDHLSDIRAKMAAVEVRATEVAAVKDDVRAVLKSMAILEAGVLKTKQDLNEAFRRLKLVGGT